MGKLTSTLFLLLLFTIVYVSGRSGLATTDVAPYATFDASIDLDQEKESAKTLEKKSDHMKKATQSYEIALTKTVVVLIGLLVLATLTIWMFKRISHGRLCSFNHVKSVKILEKRSLSPKSMLYLIEVGKKKVLMAESQISIKHISSFEEGIDVEKDL